MPSNKTVAVQSFMLQNITLDIAGVTELIVNNWSEKAKRQMLDKQMGKAAKKKEAKSPEDDYLASLYYLEDGGYGFPATGFKAAIVGACRQFDKNTINMTLARQAILVEQDGLDSINGTPLVRVEGTPRMREDMVRVGMGTADIRFRAGFPEWRAQLRITFDNRVISEEMLVNLVQAAGFGGIGEWRPSKAATGWAGRFRLALP